MTSPLGPRDGLFNDEHGNVLMQGGVIFLFGNLLQYHSHRILASLSASRPPDTISSTKHYGMPSGRLTLFYWWLSARLTASQHDFKLNAE